MEGGMVGYEVRLKGEELELVEDADTYTQEGPLTTFFRRREGAATLDSWATRLASYRTADITRIRWFSDDQYHLRTRQALGADGQCCLIGAGANR
jgi:hypothetical protein